MHTFSLSTSSEVRVSADDIKICSSFAFFDSKRPQSETMSASASLGNNSLRVARHSSLIPHYLQREEKVPLLSPKRVPLIPLPPSLYRKSGRKGTDARDTLHHIHSITQSIVYLPLRVYSVSSTKYSCRLILALSSISLPPSNTIVRQCHSRGHRGTYLPRRAGQQRESEDY